MQKNIRATQCDRCKSVHEGPPSLTMRVHISGKRWQPWELCSTCESDLYDFLRPEGTKP